MGTRPLKEGFKLFNLEYEKFLTEDAANKSVLDLSQTLSDFQKLDSLGAVSSYTPLVDTLLDGLEQQLSALGVHVDKDELKATPFNQIGAYFSENVVQTLVLGEALALKPGDNALLITLCYGEEGVDYEIETRQTEEGEKQVFVMKEGHSPMTVGGIKSNDMNTLLEKITLEAALNVTADSDAPIRYLAYGSEGVNYEIRTENGVKSVVMLTDPATNEPYKKKTIAALTAADADLLGGAKIRDLMTVGDDATGILAAVKDWTIGELSDPNRIERLKISQIIDTDSANELGKKLASWRVGELTNGNKFDTLLLGDVISIDENSPVILRNLAEMPLGGCGDAVNTFRLSDILGESIADNKLLGKLQNSTLQTLSQDIERFTVADLFGEELYSYLRITTDTDGNRLTYAEIVKAYETGHADADGSKKDLNPVIISDQSEERKNIQSYFVHGGDVVIRGVFEKTDGGYILLGNNLNVYTDGARKYVERNVVLTPVYAWSIVDYETGGVRPLPAGDSVSNDNTGKTLSTPAGVSGESYLQDGKPLYYLSGDKYYPLFTDAYSVYYVNEQNARIDLDFSIASYTTPDGLTLLPEGGKVTYGGREYFIKTKKASGSQETGDYAAGYDYITAQITVEEYFYRQTDASFTQANLYAPEQVEERWRLDNGDGTYTEVDRFLDGVWYLIFGGEKRDADGNLILDADGAITVIDRTDTPLFETANSISSVTQTLNKMPLWMLYLHGVISANPYAELPGGGNLNELTITGCIQYIANLTAIGG